MPKAKAGEPLNSERAPSGIRILPPGVHVEGETTNVILLAGKGMGRGYAITLEEFGVRIQKEHAGEFLIPWGRIQAIEYAVGQ
jgi:hypothetical protein